MLETARQFVRDLRLDVDTEEMFVPGVRRGFAILPYGPREGENTMMLRQRLQGALSKVKAASFVAPGRERPAWMVYSRSPAERRRSALAGKIKRLVLQLAGDTRLSLSLEVEWGSGTAWRNASGECGLCCPSTRRPCGNRGGGWTPTA
jgi:hypothetical protein